jgi:hypothetical protein
VARSATSEDSHLTYGDDNRNEPDDPRHEEFDRAWDDGVRYKNGETPRKFSADPKLSDLTWSGLGFRLGAIFGDVDEAARNHLFAWCAADWYSKEVQGIVEDTK